LVLLKALAQAPDQRAENWRLLQATRRELDEKSKASLEVQIVNLRKKIVQAGYTDPSIRAIRGEGYQLVCPVQIT
jgi:DNA-binding response OmpR family regulator